MCRIQKTRKPRISTSVQGVQGVQGIKLVEKLKKSHCACAHMYKNNPAHPAQATTHKDLTLHNTDCTPCTPCTKLLIITPTIITK